MHVPTNQNGPTSTPTSPAHTKHGNAEDVLWISVCSAEDLGVTFSAAPSGYSNGFGIVTVASGAPGCSILGASKQATAVTAETPGSFTGGGSSNSFINTTIAILPTVASYPTETHVATAVTADSTPTFNLPAGVAAGDLLIVGWRSGASLSSPNVLPAGWSMLATPASGDGSSDYAGAAWIRASGGENSVTWADFGTSSNFAAVAWCIKNASDPSSSAITSEAAVGNGGDPPVVNPGLGSRSYLWITFISAEDNNPGIAAPQGYEGFISQTVSTGAPGCAVVGASRQLPSTSEDPDTFWISSTRRMMFTAGASFVAPSSTDTYRPQIGWPRMRRG
jgi:hypothetical protein